MHAVYSWEEAGGIGLLDYKVMKVYRFDYPQHICTVVQRVGFSPSLLILYSSYNRLTQPLVGGDGTLMSDSLRDMYLVLQWRISILNQCTCGCTHMITQPSVVGSGGAHSPRHDGAHSELENKSLLCKLQQIQAGIHTYISKDANRWTDRQREKHTLNIEYNTQPDVTSHPQSSLGRMSKICRQARACMGELSRMVNKDINY